MRFFTLFTVILWAQSPRPWRVGAQVGLNIPAYRSNQPVDKAVILPGFTGGLTLQYELAERWTLASGVYFNQRNSAYTINQKAYGDTVVNGYRDAYTVYIVNDGRLELGHLEIPLLIEWDFRKRECGRSFLSAGAHIGYLLFARNYGQVQVSLEGLDALPLIGFSPQTRVIVAEGPIDNSTLSFRKVDTGVWFGGGNAFPMGKGQMLFEIRTFWGLVNLFRMPADTRLYNGSVMFMTGYLF
uniref:Outer membrane protein beta-barrel domain-containing protein n=1 Tax=uncultured Bacteroidota bacterium TaxID=152509 RepID=H5SMU2_9BACT|nr:hypothetical protein HGMM_F50F04C41 [uncultured Bacteroidetes bacterium]